VTLYTPTVLKICLVIVVILVSQISHGVCTHCWKNTNSASFVLILT